MLVSPDSTPKSMESTTGLTHHPTRSPTASPTNVSRTTCVSTMPTMDTGAAPSDWRDAIYYQYFEYPGWHMVRRHVPAMLES